MPTYSPYVQERWELVEYVNSTVLDDVAQPVWRESSAGGLADVYGLSRLRSGHPQLLRLRRGQPGGGLRPDGA